MIEKTRFPGSVHLLLCASLLYSLLLVSCSEDVSGTIAAIEKTIPFEDGAEFDLGTLSEFDWDRLYIYGSYGVMMGIFEEDLGDHPDIPAEISIPEDEFLFDLHGRR